MKSNSILLSLVFCLLATAIFSQDKYTISGYIKDIESGEDLIEANVYIKENPTQGTNSNIYGFYSLTMESGEYTFVFSYLGYTDKEVKITLNKDTRLNIDMGVGVEIEAVVVYAEAPDQNEQSTNMGTVELDIEQIKKLPTLLGEVDIFKAIQLLPGVQSAGEGNSGFYVRGGGPDQNLVLLDEAVVYNTGHLLGFFSVFNPDVVKNTTLIKGSMPANYGGRLSSVVDIQMKDGNNKGYQIEGGLGLIASRLSVQGPIVKNKSSFMLSGRRTYAFDLAQPLINTTDAAGTNYYFYDVNGKFNYKFSDKDRIFVSTYWGDDVLNFKTAARDFNLNIPYGNLTTTVRWNHLFSDKLFMNVSAIYNKYDFEIKFSQDQFAAKVISGIRDWNGKVDFDYYPHPKHEMKFGVNYTHHKLTPQNLTASSGDTEFELAFDPKFAHELGIYVLDDWKVTDNLTVNIGFRLSAFTQIGPYTSKIDGDQFGKGEAVKTYVGPEPRISAKYSFKDHSSIKAGVAQTNQYLHLVSSSTSTLPSDIWVPSSELIKPQRAQQYALGYFKNFKDNMFETSVELYYKNLENQIDFQESYVNQPSEDVEDNFVFGEGSSYGVEFFVNKKKGNLTGWIGYTLSKTQRKFAEINDGNPYPAIYDRRHDLSVVANYELNDKWNFGAVFVYGTGNAFTRVKSFYFIEGNFVPEYGVRNQGRIDAYHRLDLSATFTPKPNKPNKKIDQSWTFSVYNTYNRKNVYFIYYVPETNVATGEAQISAFKVSLFPVIPSVSWNFKWKQKKKK
jgi:hypothetical protein